MKQLIDILFLGDIVGKPGRHAVAQFLKELNSGRYVDDPAKGFKEKPDFIIGNAENASHGFGLTERNYNELSELGINALTSGNHIWDKKEIFYYIDRADRLLRPINYPKEVPGIGSKVFKINKKTSIGVINILGRVFMSPMDSPWEMLKDEVTRIQYETPIIIVDFHAEATAEKVCFGYFADKLGVSAVIGTHTHIQTADEKILEAGSAYITDVGFCGAYDSIIGMEISGSLKRLVTGLPERYDVAAMGKAEINAVRILVDAQTGKAEEIKRIRYYTYVSEEQKGEIRSASP